MFCQKCGKFINYNAPVCQECQMQAQPQPQAPQAPQAPQPPQPPQPPQAPQAPQQPNPYANAYNPYVANPYAAPNYQQHPQMAPIGNNAMYGFGKGLTSTILAVVGYIFYCIIAAIPTEIDYWYGTAYYSDESLAAIAILFIASIPVSILSLVFGIQAINCFKARKQFSPKPVAALILGIIGLSMSAFLLLLLIIVFFAVVAALN